MSDKLEHPCFHRLVDGEPCDLKCQWGSWKTCTCGGHSPRLAAYRAGTESPQNGTVFEKEINLLETTDAMIWAREFVRCKAKNKWTLADIDEGLMITWFAASMCAQMDKDAADLEAAQDKLRRIKRIISVFSLQRPYRQVNQIYEILEAKP